MTYAKYENIRQFMEPGDDIMFGGSGIGSLIVKIATNSPVSHIGSVLRTGRGRVKIIESTQLDGKDGVGTAYMSDILKSYDGNIWWCPLSERVRRDFDEIKFLTFMFQQRGKKYDMPQAIKSAIDIGLPFENKEDFTKLYCSEIRTGALEKATEGGEVWSLKGINASEVTPKDCYRQNLHAPTYTQLLGRHTEISGYN
jgi:hypothetical protein